MGYSKQTLLINFFFWYTFWLKLNFTNQWGFLLCFICFRRGLSKYYDGKSESFTSLASVERLEDLAKRVSPIRKKMKSCKSFGGGFDAHKSIIPRATIAKKASRSRRKTSLLSGSRSAISVNGNWLIICLTVNTLIKLDNFHSSPS